MSPVTKGKLVQSREVTHPEAAGSERHSGEHGPQSSFHSRRPAETGLSDLAIRLADDLPLTRAIELAISSLAQRLPECVITVRRADASPQTEPGARTSWDFDDASLLPRPHTSHSSGRCEWRLSETPEELWLVVELRQARRPRDVARVMELAEPVAALLGAAIRRDTLRRQLVAQSEQVLQLRKRVIQTEKLASYGQLVASIIHDLNNPLTAILAYSEYLNRSLPAAGVPAPDIERLARIREAADTVLRHTRSLVDYARPPQSPVTAVDINAVIDRALALCEHEFARTGLRAKAEVAPHLPPAMGHAEQLTQLFVNLFTNAAHAARSEQAWLKVGAFAELETGRLTVKVHDNGIGIQPSDIEHVFEPFYTTKGGGGCGLGLSIVRDIVQYHGGDVSVSSIPLVGTTFTLSLPIAPQT